MTTTGDWRKTATTWAGVIARYIEYRQMKTWRGRTHGPDGRELPDHLDGRSATKLEAKLRREIDDAVKAKHLPPKPHPWRDGGFSAFLKSKGVAGRPARKCPTWIQQIRKAVVLNRDRYTCRYCGRTAWGVFEEEGRTLRFEMDHGTARARIPNCDDFDLTNIFAACRSCNVIKGQMEEQPFRRELRSLARAVAAQQH
jgi:hypothetical protein